MMPFNAMRLRSVPSATPFFTSDPMLSSGWEPVTGPGAIYKSDSDKTYVAWQFVGTSAKGVHVASFDHGLGAWSSRYSVGNFALPDDDHGHPALVRDADGYWYCFYGSHLNSQQWSISNAPNDISAWTKQASISGSFTYPKVNLVGSTIYLMMRDSSTSGNWKLVLKTATPSSGSASFGASTILVDFGSDSRVYTAEAHVRGTDIHFLCAMANNSDTSRKGVYYFVYKTSTGALENFDGTFSKSSGALPITLAEANTNCRIHDSGANNGDLGSLQFDSSGNAHVIFAEGTTSPYDLKHMYLSGGSWTSPTTIGAIVDRSPSTGYVDTYTLVPGAGGVMEAWYNDNGNKVRRVFSGGAWGGQQTMAVAGPHDFVQGIAVRDADSDLRVFFSENLGSVIDANAVPLGLFGYGDSGFSRPIDMTPIDPYWDDVVLLVSPVGRNGATALIDQSDRSAIISLSGNAQIQSNKLELDGDDFATLLDDSSWVWSGDFTIELFGVEFDTVGIQQVLLSHYDAFSPVAGNRGWFVSLEGALSPKKLRVVTSADGSAVTTPIDYTWSPATGTPYDICVERSGTTLRAYINGAMVASATFSSTTFNSTSPLAIGSDNTRATTISNRHELDGRMGVIRYTKAARYASDSGYIVPAVPLPNK